MTRPSTPRLLDRYAPVVAIFGQESSIGGFRLLGSGVVVDRKLVLTSRHVIDDRPDSRTKIRVFSQGGGISVLDQSEDPFLYPVRGAGIANDAALLRLEDAIEGIEPATVKIAPALPAGTPCTIPGFGGRTRGLLEERQVETVEAKTPSGDELIRFRLPSDQSLRYTDSGSPVFRGDDVIGVYFGRDNNRRPVAVPLDEELETKIKELGATDRDKGGETTCYRSIGYEREQAYLGIGETQEHSFEWKGETADLGVVALNGAALAAGAEEADVRFKVSLEEPDGTTRQRSLESQFQTFWRQGDIVPGTYRLRVTASAAAAVYEVNWNIYEKA